MAVKKTFLYKLGEDVKLIGGEAGKIIGRAQYLDSNPQYQLRYVAADGRLTECWWNESAFDSYEPHLSGDPAQNDM